ncbi:hypothetical protein BJ138DRAFT_1152032 [Hygrophoropsis aurantiaca]|uniref:Uncharacterized protein n=1 Tax=Hygrophoropsis aurantiaca TaxID=72124 RepID=A0ACB8ACI5_9AGAM|nr:hypothetical protein BJ138DRAFT_1152032 [Hygrophoropsis aurantiaca]
MLARGRSKTNAPRRDPPTTVDVLSRDPSTANSSFKVVVRVDDSSPRSPDDDNPAPGPNKSSSGSPSEPITSSSRRGSPLLPSSYSYLCLSTPLRKTSSICPLTIMSIFSATVLLVAFLSPLAPLFRPFVSSTSPSHSSNLRAQLSQFSNSPPFIPALTSISSALFA